jgi:hypothetical protein
MKHVIRFALAPVLALALLAFGPGTADAQTAGVAVVQGTGTISPGLLPVPSAQTFTFNSVQILTAGVVHGAPSVLGSSDCTAGGRSLAVENTALGAGSGTWSCGPVLSTAGALVYVRVGAAVGVVITGGLNGALGCAFIPTTGNGVTTPVTGYSLACGGAAAGLA